MDISAVGSRTTLAYLPEAFYGEIGEPALIWGEGSFVWGDDFEWGLLLFQTQYLRAKYGTTFEIKKDSFASTELSVTRQENSLIYGTRTGSGQIPFEFSYETFDKFLEAVTGGSWDSDVLKIGNRKRSFTIEQANPDIGVYEQNLGVVFTAFNLSVKPNAMIEGSFSLMFQDQTSTATICATPTPANSNNVYNSFVGTLTVDSVPAAIVTGIDIKLDQNASDSKVLFKPTIQQISLGRVKVTGTLVVRFIDNALKAKFLTGTALSLLFTIGTGVNGEKSYSFFIPTAKFTTATKSTDEMELTQTFGFNALYDSTEGSTLTITRIP
jgi:hypothetical protein